MPHLLLVDDDYAVRLAISRLLRQRGWEVTVVGSAEEADDMVSSWTPDAVLLDWGLPGRQGVELVSDWRGRGLSFPVILLTARNTVDDLVEGLAAGADDYLRKPCFPKELMARLEARMRGHGESGGPGRLTLTNCVVDLDLQQIEYGDEIRRLTTREAELLSYLARRAGQSVTRDELLQEIWGYSPAVVTRSVDNVVRRLRTKIEPDPATPRHVLTVHGVGYRFEP
jgi:DNA-binding response OmpR family regulator